MEFLVVVKSLRVIVEGFQAIARPPEALATSTAMELLFFQRRDKAKSGDFAVLFVS
jgi:hypothetical protein